MQGEWSQGLPGDELLAQGCSHTRINVEVHDYSFQMELVYQILFHWLISVELGEDTLMYVIAV